MGSIDELFDAIEAGDVRAIRSLIAEDPGAAAAG